MKEGAASPICAKRSSRYHGFARNSAANSGGSVCTPTSFPLANL
jgi:predicted outer membrane repeat protein